MDWIAAMAATSAEQELGREEVTSGPLVPGQRAVQSGGPCPYLDHDPPGQ